MEDINKIIKTRRHDLLKARSDTWVLCRDSYIGGEQYRAGNHLSRYYKEHSISYKDRLKRSIYINHVKPLADILTGFLFAEKPAREYSKQISYVETNLSKNQGLQSVMQNVALQSMLFPVFILVDSPSFDNSQILTKADRKAAGLNPFCTLYKYNEIRDFATDDSGKLLWILLDNSYVDKSNPLEPAKTKTVYRLWTREYFQDFTFAEKDEVAAGEQMFHGLGVVPGVFAGFPDLNNDSIDSSLFESVSLMSKGIYNTVSAMQEKLYDSTFSTLFFPLKSGEDLPDVIKKSGVGSLVVVPYNGELSGKPEYSQSGTVDIEPFLATVQLLTGEILKQVGMRDASEKGYNTNQSGVALEIEFRKTESILLNIATDLENVERSIIETVQRWERLQDKVSVSYSRDFKESDITSKLEQLYNLYTLPIESLQKSALKRIVKTVLDDASKEEMSEIDQDIEKHMTPPAAFNAGDNITA